MNNGFEMLLEETSWGQLEQKEASSVGYGHNVAEEKGEAESRLGQCRV